MIDAEKLLRGILGAKVRGRKRRSGLSSLVRSPLGRTLGAGALGLALAAYDHYRRPQGSPRGLSSSGTPPKPPPQPPASPVPPATAADRDAHLLIRAMIAAAQADGHIDEQEREAILRRLSAEESLNQQEKEFLSRELSTTVDLSRLLQQVDSDDLRQQIYIVSLLAIDIDTGAEKEYLSTLAQKLNLPQHFVDSVNASFGVEGDAGTAPQGAQR